MGIYVFNTEFLYEQLIRDADSPTSSHDFGKDVIPACVGRHDLYAYAFRGPNVDNPAYWRDVGTVDAYYSANIEMLAPQPALDLYDEEWPIWTRQAQLPPAKFINAEDGTRGAIERSMVSGACVIEGADVEHSLLFSGVRVGAHAEIADCVVLPDVQIGAHCRIRRAVIDKRCNIPARTVIGYDASADAERFHLSPAGVVLVTPDMLGQAVHRIR
jgi:glucose-1-phosphate adenylyltransferase